MWLRSSGERGFTLQGLGEHREDLAEKETSSLGFDG